MSFSKTGLCVCVLPSGWLMNAPTSHWLLLDKRARSPGRSHMLQDLRRQGGPAALGADDREDAAGAPGAARAPARAGRAGRGRAAAGRPGRAGAAGPARRGARGRGRLCARAGRVRADRPAPRGATMFPLLLGTPCSIACPSKFMPGAPAPGTRVTSMALGCVAQLCRSAHDRPGRQSMRMSVGAWMNGARCMSGCGSKRRGVAHAGRGLDQRLLRAACAHAHAGGRQCSRPCPLPQVLPLYHAARLCPQPGRVSIRVLYRWSSCGSQHMA